MLGYFRKNDPYRLILIFIVLFLFRLPYLISNNWLTIPELSWMIVGERLNEGAMLYVGVWDDIGPLSALVYRLINFLFGRSQLSIQILGIFLFFFQVFFMNYISLKHKMYNENNYLPALFYGILGLSFFNIMVLSPQLMGLTFVLLSLNSLFKHIETRDRIDGNLLNIGLYIGIASLFYLPYLNLIFVHIIGLLFFTNTIGRRYLLLLYGAFVPLIICWLIYSGYGKNDELFGNFFTSIFKTSYEHYLSFKTILILFGSSILLFSLSSFKTLSGFGFTVFQVRVQKVMFFAAIVTLAIYAFYTEGDGYSLVMFCPWGSFFLSHFFLSLKNKLKRELSFLVYFLLVIFFYFGITFYSISIYDQININRLLFVEDQKSPAYANRKVLVIGPDISPYYFSKQATPYFNWELSKGQLEKLDYYDNLESINNNLRSDMPDFIIDQINLVPKLFDHIPPLAMEYALTEPGIYKRKDINN